MIIIPVITKQLVELYDMLKFNLSYKYWFWMNLVRVLNKVQNPRFEW